MENPEITDSTNPQASPEIDAPPGIEISGQANVTARDIVGGDKIVRGDEVLGTKIVGYSAEQVSILLAQISTSYQPRPFDGRSPYVGLASFQEQDADKFFGRETLIADLVSRAGKARAVFVGGPSGSGKSSLVRAGLVPALKKGALPGSERWLYETCKPGRSPLDELGRATAGLAGKIDARQDVVTRGLNDATILSQWADIALGDDGARCAVLFVDQFEETFTQVAKEDERAAFLNLLTHAASMENGRVILLFALRSDFVSHCASYPELNALLSAQFLQVGAMTPDELVSAIARPALQVGLKLDPALIAQIVNDVRGEPGALPLMQFALQDLFEHEKDKGELTLDGYLARGGLRKALERHADAEFQKLDEGEKQLARTVFSGLIEVGRGTVDTKRTALFDELVPAGVESAQVKRLVTELADARLVTTDEQDGKETVTLAHERLLEAWDWLRRLVNENREAIALQNEIAQDAKDWETADKSTDYLYRGAQLETAQERLEDKKLVLSGLASTFIETAVAARDSERAEREAERQRELERERDRADAQERARIEADKRAAAETQRARILRLATIGLSALVIVALAAIVSAWWLSRSSDARRLAVIASALRDSHPDLAFLLATQAKQLDANAEVQSTYMDLVTGPTYLAGHLPGIPGKDVDSVAFSPDGKILATGGSNNIVLWDMATRQRIGEPIGGLPYDVFDLKFSPDGKTLAAVLWNEVIFLDVATHQTIRELTLASASQESFLAFSPDGSLFATSTGEGTIVLRDSVSGQPSGAPLALPWGSAGPVAFSPDGKVLAGAGRGEILFWDMATRKRTGQTLSDASAPLAFSPDGKRLAYQGTEKNMIVWDLETGRPLTRITGLEDEIASVAFSPDGKLLAAVGDCARIDAAHHCIGSDVYVWDAASGRAVGPPRAAHFGSGKLVAFSPNGTLLVSVGEDMSALGESNQYNAVFLWNVEKSKPVGQQLTGHTGSVNSVAFSPDGSFFATGGNDKTVRLWDTVSRAPIGEAITGPTDAVESIAISPDGKILAAGSCAKRGPPDQPDNCAEVEFFLWDLTTRQLLGRLPTVHKYYIRSLVFSPDSKQLASASADGTIVLWDVEARRPIGEPLNIEGILFGLAFRADWTQFVSGGRDAPIKVWDVKQRAPLSQTYETQKDYVSWQLAFSPDGKLLVSGGFCDFSTACNEIYVWDATTRQSLGQLNQGGTVGSIAFRPDGSMFAAGGCGDGSEYNDCKREIVLWDAKTRQRIAQTLPGQVGRVNSLAYSPDGHLLVSGNDDGTVIVWDASPSAWREPGCYLAHRNFTRDEWEQYVNPIPLTYDVLYRLAPTCPGLPVESLIPQ